MRLQSGQPVDRRFRCSRICNFGRMRLRSTLPQPRGNPHLKSRRSGSGVGSRSPSCSTLFNFSALSVVLSGTFWPLRWQGEQEESSGNDPLAISGDPLFFRGVWNDHQRPVHCRLTGETPGPEWDHDHVNAESPWPAMRLGNMLFGFGQSVVEDSGREWIQSPSTGSVFVSSGLDGARYFPHLRSQDVANTTPFRGVSTKSRLL